MHLGIDFDGTITDAPAMRQRYARERWEIDLAAHEVMRAGAVPLIGEARYRQMSIATEGVLTTSTEPQADAMSVLDELWQSHEVTVITARYGHQAAFARRWLSRHGLPLRLVHTSRAPKTAICNALGVDLLLDDNINEDSATLLEAGTLPVLYELPYNRERARPNGLRAVSSWSAFAGLIAELERG